MKNIYWSTTILLILFSISVIGQGRIYPPNLRAPENNEAGQYPDVLLDWDAVTGQTTNITYEVQLATMEDFSDAITFPRTEYTAIQMEELLFGDSYYWRVKAYDSNDPSDWSESWKFQVLATVTVTRPSLGSEEYVNPEVKWNEVTGLKKYQLQIDTTYDWNVSDAGVSDDILGTFALTENDMWMVGEGGLVQHFDGTVWTSMDAGVTENLTSVYFTSADNGYVVGDGGTILHYDGANWSVMDGGTTDDLTGVSFVDADNGWAVGNGGTILNYMGGTWTASNSSVTSDIYSVFALANNNVWACGKGKIVLHFDGSAWTNEEVGTKDWNSVWFTDASNGWVVGAGGKIMYYDGNSWVEQKAGAGTKNLFAVSFSGGTGYAVGQSGTMVTFDGEWQITSSLTSEELKAISLKDGIGLMAGVAGATVLKTTDGFTSPYMHITQIAPDMVDYELENLLYGQDFYIRMRAIHSNDTSNWSAGRMFLTEPSVTLKAPASASNNMNMLLLYRWEEYKGSNEYRFEIDFNEDFSNPFVLLLDSISTNYQTKFFGRKYYWRVSAANAFDVSDWSEVWNFTTVNTVALSVPADDAMDIALCPRYQWTGIDGVSGYEIRIDTDENFSNPTIEYVQAPFFQCNKPLTRQTTYYWKVRATTTADSSDFSPTWSFETEGYLGVEDEFVSGSVDIYPNPADKNFNITINSYSKANYQISVVELTGKTIYEKEIEFDAGENTTEINLPEIPQGLYLVRINQGNKSVTKKLFVK